MAYAPSTPIRISRKIQYDRKELGLPEMTTVSLNGRLGSFLRKGLKAVFVGWVGFLGGEEGKRSWGVQAEASA